MIKYVTVFHPSVVAALLLALAASAKAADYALYTIGSEVEVFRFELGIALIMYEVFLSCWVLSGYRPTDSTRLASATFVVFAIFSAFKLARGADSCGCFGTMVSVSPLVILLIDFFVVIGLATFKPRTPKEKISISVLVIPFTVLLSAIWSYSFERSEINLLGDISGDGTVILDPDSWIGHRIPLATHVIGEDQFTQGLWTMILYRSNCDKCQSLLRKVIDDPELSSKQIVFLEIPSSDLVYLNENPEQTEHLWKRLSDKYDWFASVPVRLELHDGIVVTCSAEPEMN